MDARSLPGHAPHAFAYWSRPVRTDVCSMFARMPRYAPAASGTRSAARMRATGQNGSSRHVLVFLNSISSRINEQSSGLLIRGFGVQVPGGAPGLTWGFNAPGHSFCVRFVHLVVPWLLRGCSGAWTQQSGVCQKRAARPPRRGIRPGAGPSRTAGTAPGSLDQWSRPSMREPGRAQSPYANVVTLGETYW
jgi:hypothetical protein